MFWIKLLALLRRSCTPLRMSVRWDRDTHFDTLGRPSSNPKPLMRYVAGTKLHQHRLESNPATAAQGYTQKAMCGGPRWRSSLWARSGSGRDQVSRQGQVRRDGRAQRSRYGLQVHCGPSPLYEKCACKPFLGVTDACTLYRPKWIIRINVRISHAVDCLLKVFGQE